MATAADPFNYPSLQRKDLMSLSKISRDDEKVRKFKGGVDTHRDYSYNLFNMDIIGSSPKKFGVLTQKVDFINKNDDIERSYPKELIVQLNKPDYSLLTSDLKLRIPKFHHSTTRPPTNPLEPKYNLPKVEEIPAPIPKFIRDNINYDDVEGSKPKKLYVWATRTGMLMNYDIPGSSPKKPKIRQSKYSSFNYSDVTHDQFKTSRHVNPLEPIYSVTEKDGTKYIYGDIEGSKPSYYPFCYADPKNLKTIDIDGCKIGSLNRINQYNGTNYNLEIKDVPGAQASSKKRGITTERHVNPIWPEYVFPGHTEMKGKYNNPYGKTAFDEKNKFLKGKEESKNQDKVTSKTASNFYPTSEEKNKVDKGEELIPVEAKAEEFGENKDNKETIQHKNPASALAADNDEDQEYAYMRPDPFYGYTRDQYLKCARLKKVKPGTSTGSKTKHSNVMGKTASNSFSASKKNFGNSTMSNFNLSKAQKLDQFIGNM